VEIAKAFCTLVEVDSRALSRSLLSESIELSVYAGNIEASRKVSDTSRLDYESGSLEFTFKLRLRCGQAKARTLNYQSGRQRITIC